MRKSATRSKCKKRKKVYRKAGKRYYRSRTGRLVLLKGKKKPPMRKC